jgi:hypothetical protein
MPRPGTEVGTPPYLVDAAGATVIGAGAPAF